MSEFMNDEVPSKIEKIEQPWGYHGSYSKRIDGRQSYLQLRHIDLVFDIIKHTRGSARFCMGNTSVLAAVHGPFDGARDRRRYAFNQCIFQVVVRSIQGINTSNEKYMESCISSVLDYMIDVKSLNFVFFLIVLQPQENNGGLLNCCINAAVCAVLNAGIPCHGMYFAVSLCNNVEPHFTDTSKQMDNNETHNSSIIVDPSFQELFNNSSSFYQNLNIDLSTYQTYVIDPLTDTVILIFPETVPFIQKVCSSDFTANDTSLLQKINAASVCCKLINDIVREKIKLQMKQNIIKTIHINDPKCLT